MEAEKNMIVPNGAAIAVVDGKRLQLFQNKGHEPHIDLAPLAEPALEPANAGSGTRHRSSLANPDSRRMEEDDFVAAAASYLNKEVLQGHVRQLMVIADPRSLGELRRHFHPALEERLIAEVAKDMTGLALGEIEAALTRV
ncbi:host attachment protein [Rhizobium sp. BK377]|uniref:baeRF12 domain-containing protein n=1 Tax=Rhizobium sp. BK377 TaxID=2587058 RepID=UPI0017FF2658|nr:host attachment protein [Rhizobium sp. BK377]MBB3463108.1 protein required for attachment to host cells [Rhizobium sp. BK377]